MKLSIGGENEHTLITMCVQAGKSSHIYISVAACVLFAFRKSSQIVILCELTQLLLWHLLDAQGSDFKEFHTLTSLNGPQVPGDA